MSHNEIGHGQGAHELGRSFTAPDVWLRLPMVNGQRHWKTSLIMEETLNRPAKATLLVDARITQIVMARTCGVFEQSAHVTRQTPHGSVIGIGVCIRVMKDHIIIVDLLIREGMIRHNANHGLHVGIQTIRQVMVDRHWGTVEHDHPHKSVAIHKLFLDPFSISIHLWNRKVLVVKAFSCNLQVFKGYIDVGGQYLFIMPTTGDCVIANLLLGDPSPLAHHSTLNGPGSTIATSIHPLNARLSV
mmetsp:Transcript_58544/g.71605  ORF Transcript_58544/g.71605 Transcript_58544/m.71605 type:complete len:244 (-) Transcript_58544:105-836(-)